MRKFLRQIAAFAVFVLAGAPAFGVEGYECARNFDEKEIRCAPWADNKGASQKTENKAR